MLTIPVLLKDGYKVGHKFQYPDGTELVYSNMTPRGTRRAQSDGIIFFGLQYFILEYLIKQFNANFFVRRKDDVVREYQRRIDNYLGPGVPVDHIAALHDLQYLPLHIKAVPEGTLVPYRVPVLTIRNTKKEFFWLTNMLETVMSAVLWGPSTSATTAFQYRRNFEKYAAETGAPKGFIPWQGHDFSFRGMFGVEAALMSGAGHLLSFTGTDTIPAIDFLEHYYGANSDKELIGGSVAATEHSVMCMGGEDGERSTINRLITSVYPSGIVSIVMDTWDFWKVLTEILPSLRTEILNREGKVVVRPDSGDPVKVICGDPEGATEAERRGAIQLLWDVFGGTVNSAGYRELDPHIGLIYGDSITIERQVAILEGLKKNGFASSNVVLGIGSYTYQHVTRDTDGWAMKATFGVINGKDIEIFKAPKTDNGVKNSAKGLLVVTDDTPGNVPMLVDRVSRETEKHGLLQDVFIDDRLVRVHTLADIRARVEKQI